MEAKVRSAEMRNFFNEKAAGYDAVHLPDMDTKAAITEALQNGVRNVLDLGAGTGLELYPLFERFPEVRVRVVDIAEGMLNGLRTRPFADKLEIVAGDFFDVAFGENYDAVISSAALHHFAPADKARLYAKIFACLKPGGMFVNSDGFVDTLVEQEAHMRADVERDGENGHYDTPLAVSVEEGLLNNAGFVDFAVKEMPNPWYKRMIARKPE